VHRSPRRVAVTVLTALVLAACGPDLPRGAIATVDGEPIASTQLETWVRTATDANPQLVAGDLQADLLARVIQNRVILAVLAARGLAVDPGAAAAIDAEIRSQLGGDDGLAETLVEIGFPPEFYEEIFLVSEAALERIVTDLVGDRVLETRTARHILVGTAEDADEVVALLADGADFATLAAERSADPGSAAAGGMLGARERGVYVPEFEEAVWTARIGVVLPPVQTQFGFHVIEVLDETRTPASQLSSPERRRLVEVELDVLLRGAAAAAQVIIAPRIGVWDGDAALVRPAGSGAGGR
jgi:hypothetical protein